MKQNKKQQHQHHQKQDEATSKIGHRVHSARTVRGKNVRDFQKNVIKKDISQFHVGFGSFFDLIFSLKHHQPSVNTQHHHRIGQLKKTNL